MKITQFAKVCVLALACAVLTGCASSGGFAYEPKPPFLLNALADTSDAVADNTSGFIAWRARQNATLFRALTPGFWLDRQYGGREETPTEIAEYSAKDQAFLESSL